MADDQRDRYIQYLAGQNQDLRLTSDAMKLVLEDFMAQLKEPTEGHPEVKCYLMDAGIMLTWFLTKSLWLQANVKFKAN